MRCLIICLIALFHLQAHAEKRAFVVGVGEYQSLTDLQKTENDAEGYATVFEAELGFSVTKLINPNSYQFNRSFSRFIGSIERGDDVVFIFSGHGWSDGAESFLIFTDAPRNATEYELTARTTPLNAEIMRQIKSKNPRFSLFIIDACRNYPFDTMTRNAYERGLTPVDAGEGSFVLYSAGAFQSSLDRLSDDDSSKYSVFTRVLLPKIRDADRTIQDIARDVKNEVRELALTVNHVQRPAYYDELLNDYCFSQQCREKSLELDSDSTLWLEVSSGQHGVDTCLKYGEYLSFYPDGKYADRAEALLTASPCLNDDDATRIWQEGVAAELDANLENALKSHSLACTSGHAEACADLGRILSSEHRSTEELDQYFRLFERACQGGSGRGCLWLGEAYEYGHGVERNLLGARHAYDKSCRLQIKRGCSLEFHLYYNSNRNVQNRESLPPPSRRCEREDLSSCALLYITAEHPDNQEKRLFELNYNICAAGNSTGCSILFRTTQKDELETAFSERAMRILEHSCARSDVWYCEQLAKGNQNSDR